MFGGCGLNLIVVVVLNLVGGLVEWGEGIVWVGEVVEEVLAEVCYWVMGGGVLRGVMAYFFEKAKGIKNCTARNPCQTRAWSN